MSLVDGFAPEKLRKTHAVSSIFQGSLWEIDFRLDVKIHVIKWDVSRKMGVTFWKLE